MREGEHSWVCTVATQIFICCSLFIVLNIGRPQEHHVVHSPPAQRSDVYFLSVVGGSRPTNEQIILLQQMAKVAKACNAEFVINISELAEDDPLMKNATLYFQSLTVPWYLTKSQKATEPDYFLKRIAIPGGKSLDIITVNAEVLKDFATGTRKHQLSWLTTMLGESMSDWRILVGFDPLLPCNGSMDGEGNLQHLFLTHRVNAYLSGLACAEYVDKEVDEWHSHANQMLKGPFLITPNDIFRRHEVRDMAFLLHRVNSLEFATYLVTLKGKVVHEATLKQMGKQVM